MPRFFILLFCLLILAQPGFSQTTAQFRGPDRNGVFPETGLLKSWPESGPELKWAREDLDRGFSSVSITDEAIYLAGLEGSSEFLTILDFEGNTVWRIQYGRGSRQTHRDTRCTPTVEGERVYLVSGQGEVVCINSRQKKIQWSVNAFEKFQGEFWQWEIAESPLLVDNKVIYTPGGNLTSMVALDKLTGETLWQTESLETPSAFVSPILVEFGGKKIIVGVLTEHIVGVDAENGKFLWTVKYHDIETPTFHPWAPKNNCVTPLYHDGHLFVTSGYDHVGVMFRLLGDGTEIEQVWINKELDNHHGQIVRIGSFIYGSNWIDNPIGNWCCVDWETGKTMYEKTWETKGSVSAADGMLYCYEEKRGNLALVLPTPDDFTIVSSFRITLGSGPHWTQPVIHKGVLYIRHGPALMAYNIKA
ncbi:PQQ-binding-like beta-propeller repeat protein [Acidobacteriota bacterium]